MEGKKIGFIVVSLILIGGVSYYLYSKKKSSEGSDVPNTKSPETVSDKGAVAPVNDRVTQIVSAPTVLAPTTMVNRPNPRQR
jgi:hypothetical protein